MFRCREDGGRLAERHRRACAGFTAVVDRVEATAWVRPTPCGAWDAAALVEHVIGFHEYLLLRPAGVRANRPRSGPSERWHATERAVGVVLDDAATLERPVGYFDGAERRPGELLAALTGDVLVHTWDLARAVGAPEDLDPELCALAYRDALTSRGARARSGMFAPEVTVPEHAELPARLLGLLGRDPAWRSGDVPRA